MNNRHNGVLNNELRTKKITKSNMGLKNIFLFLEFLQPLTIYIFFFRWGMSNKQTLDNKSISK